MSQSILEKYPSATTINEVIVQLEQIVEESARRQNFICAFGYVYLRTTEEIKKAIVSGKFENPVLLERLDVVFANLFITAYKSFCSGHEPFKAWKYAFDRCEKKLVIIQHILLGMNAHINLDLAVAAAKVAPGPKIIALKNDFMTVNQILGNLTDPMQRGLQKASPLMGLLDIFGFKKDEKVINFSIRKARDFAWLNAMELALLDAQAQSTRIVEIDRRVVEISTLIADPPGQWINFLLWIISGFESGNPAKVLNALKNAH